MKRSVFRRALDSVCRAFSWVSGALTLVLMLLVVAEVVMRDFFDSTLGGTLEISEVLLVFVVFTGVAYAQQVGDHVSTDLVTSRMPRQAAAIVRTTGLAIAAGVILWLAWVSLGRGLDAMAAGESRFGLRSVPVWPARLVIPLGALLLGLQTLMSASDAWRGRLPDWTDPDARFIERAGIDDGPGSGPGPSRR